MTSLGLRTITAGAAMLFAMGAVAQRADAAITLTAQAAAGTDLSAISVGSYFTIDVTLIGAPDELLVSMGQVTVRTVTNAALSSYSFPFIAAGTNLEGSRAMMSLTFQVIAAGSNSIRVFFNPLSDGIVTSEGRFFPTTNTVDYTVRAVPEIASWAMMIAGLAGVGGMMRRRSKIAVRFA